MKYKLIGQNDFGLEPVEQVLKNRGINNMKEFIKPSESNIIHYSKLKNIDKAVECFLRHAQKGGKVTVIVDSDPDGFTSAASFINYMKKVFPMLEITYVLPEGKEHGISLDKVPDETELLIVPDAGSNNFEEHRILSEKGIDVIVLDHHEASKESEHAIVVNSQLSPDYPNKALTGVGIVYRFLQALDEKLGVKYADNFLDLVAIGNIADSAYLGELETRYYVNKGLNKIKNKFLKEFYKAQEFSTKGETTITSTSFYINPAINATIRVGDQEEKKQLFEALLESDEEIFYSYRKVERWEDISVNTARKIKNIKARQDRMRDKGVELIKERIQEKNLLKNKILIINITGILEKNLSGLVANQLAKLYKRPILLLRKPEDKEGVLSGSGRGYDKSPIKDFKQFVNDSGFFNFAEGHAGAFGVEIDIDKIVAANDYFNEQLKDVEIDVDTYDVDFELSEKQAKPNFIFELNDYRHLWGGGVDEPLIAFKELNVNKEDMALMGKNKSKTFKFKLGQIEFVKFFCSEEWFEEMFSKDCTYVLNVVAKASKNEWNGDVTPQCIIEDFEIVEVKKKELVF